MKFKHILAGSALCAMVFCFQTQVQAASAEENNEVISEGVYAGEVELSGMTRAQAQTAIDRYYGDKGASLITVNVNDQKVTTTLNDLGYTYGGATAVEEALGLGKSGNLISRYKTQMDLKYDKIILEVSNQIDEAKVADFVEAKIAVLDTPAKDATITRENGRFVVTQHTTGLAADQAATVQAILDAADSLSENTIIEAVVKVTEPSRTYEALSTISDSLGSFTTDYSSSASGRKTNIKVGSGNISGSVVMPGENLSVSDTMKPREPENGYQLGGEYVNGDTVQSYGGGVCQVSTTLYNALLLAELQIDERHPHSMVVSYVKHSMDAAIANGYKDLKFTNNTDYPIYIDASANGSSLTFTIYGKEYRPANRTIEYRSVTTKQIESVTKEVYDPNLPADQKSEKGSNHPQVTSYLEKLVYVDGKLTDTIRVRPDNDNYSASYKVRTIGTGAPAETTPAETTAPTAAPSEPPTEPPTEPTQPPAEPTQPPAEQGDAGNT